MTASSRYFSIMLLAMLISVTAHAQDSELAVAEKLIRAMRLDQFVVQGTASEHLRKPPAVGSVAPTDEQRRNFLRCLEHADTSSVVRGLANVVVRQLSRREMREALAFYDSSAGKKQVQRELIEAQQRYGYELAATSPVLSVREKASLDRFRKTRAYGRLEESPAVIKETRETSKAVYQGGYMVATTCFSALGLPKE